MDNGFYASSVTDDRIRSVHVDEDTVMYMQTARLFKNRDKVQVEQQKTDKANQRKADRLAIKKVRKFRTMIKECAWLACTAALVYCTYRWGLHVAIATIVGCVVALCCRILNYNTMKER